jgi:Flp pilus assembly protein TadG
MKRKLRNRRCQGSALIETALCLTIFIALLLGLMNVGFLVFSYHSISEVAREGARYASVRGSGSCTGAEQVTNCNATAATLQSYIAGLGFVGLSSSNVTVKWCKPPVSGTVDTTCASTNTHGNMVKVTVTYTTDFSLPMYSTRLETLTSTAQMLVSQ